jgi:hypothetical protein
MAKLSQKQLDELVKKRKENKANIIGEDESLNHVPFDKKIINEIMDSKKESAYKYKLPNNILNSIDEGIPYVNPNEFPELKIKGKYSSDRQNKGANLFLLKETDHILDKINKGKNKNATLNFLVWVGLQTIKGMNGSIDIRVHDSTYADGEMITDFIKTS